MRQLMSRSIFCFIGLLVCSALLLSGCGYRPLYGTKAEGKSVQTVLAGIAIEEQDSRAGQLVRNDLMSTMGAAAGGNVLYQLKLEPVERTTLVSSLPGQKLQRKRYRLTTKYVLVDAASSKVVSEGASFSDVSFDTVREPVADLQAADNARDRATREVAEDIRLRLAAFISAANG
jgi:LPS-assembly lipoprotein